MLTQFDDEETAAYFERLNSQLRKMPREERAELHTELRQHLDALAAAHEELGASPEEAARAALRQFGDPKRIGCRLFGEWRRSRPRSYSLWAAIGHMTLWKILMFSVPLATGSSHNMFSSEASALCFVYSLFFISPFLAGLITGWKMPKQAAPGAFYSGLLFALPVVGLTVFSGLSADALAPLVIAFDWLAVSFVGAYAASAHRLGGFYRLSLSDFKFRTDEKEARYADRI